MFFVIINICYFILVSFFYILYSYGRSLGFEKTNGYEFNELGIQKNLGKLSGALEYDDTVTTDFSRENRLGITLSRPFMNTVFIVIRKLSRYLFLFYFINIQ